MCLVKLQAISSTIISYKFQENETSTDDIHASRGPHTDAAQPSHFILILILGEQTDDWAVNCREHGSQNHIIDKLYHSRRYESGPFQDIISQGFLGRSMMPYLTTPKLVRTTTVSQDNILYLTIHFLFSWCVGFVGENCWQCCLRMRHLQSRSS